MTSASGKFERDDPMDVDAPPPRSSKAEHMPLRDGTKFGSTFRREQLGSTLSQWLQGNELAMLAGTNRESVRAIRADPVAMTELTVAKALAEREKRLMAGLQRFTEQGELFGDIWLEMETPRILLDEHGLPREYRPQYRKAFVELLYRWNQEPPVETKTARKRVFGIFLKSLGGGKHSTYLDALLPGGRQPTPDDAILGVPDLKLFLTADLVEDDGDLRLRDETLAEKKHRLVRVAVIREHSLAAVLDPAEDEWTITANLYYMAWNPLLQCYVRKRGGFVLGEVIQDPDEPHGSFDDAFALAGAHSESKLLKLFTPTRVDKTDGTEHYTFYVDCVKGQVLVPDTPAAARIFQLADVQRMMDECEIEAEDRLPLLDPDEEWNP
jgi:hypothetical protein